MAHTNIPRRRDIDALAERHQPGCVSIYTPAGPLPADGERARIELKNQLRDAVAHLQDAGAEKATVAQVEADATSLLEDPLFWQYQSNSLATFIGDGVFETYRLPNRLPQTLDIADRFYIKPLVRAITFPQAAFVLALARGSVRLIKLAADQPAHVVDVAEMPENIDSFLNLDLSGRSTFGKETEDQELRDLQFTSAINKAVLPVIRDSDLPLIIAAAQPLASTYRRTNGYKRLSSHVISGNPEHLAPQALGEKARPILDEIYSAELTRVREDIAAKAAQGSGATELAVVARAALMGAIETLMVDIDTRIPGYLDEDSGEVVETASDGSVAYGVGDEILRRALTGGARVYGVRGEDMPNEAPIAAAFRFPVS